MQNTQWQRSEAFKGKGLFVCLSMKATHLEIVGELFNNVFIATLHRFLSRRSKPMKYFQRQQYELFMST